MSSAREFGIHGGLSERQAIHHALLVLLAAAIHHLREYRSPWRGQQDIDHFGVNVNGSGVGMQCIE